MLVAANRRRVAKEGGLDGVVISTLPNRIVRAEQLSCSRQPWL